MKSNLKRNCFFLLLVGISFSASAQKTFPFKAEIQQVERDGFYKVYLKPGLVAKCKADLSDLRISDNKGQFIPYIKYDIQPDARASFISFPLLSDPDQPDSISSVIAENSRSLLIQSLWLRLKNTAVLRTVDILGSDDMQKWFAIKEGIVLKEAEANTSDSYYQALSFPPGRYRYFKIIVNNKRKSPVNILQVGIFSDQLTSPQFIAVPSPVISLKDSSDKISYIKLSFKDNYQINKLGFSISYPKFFNRRVLIYELKGKERSLIAETSLNSDLGSDVLFSGKSKVLELQIINGDNPPLKIKQVQAWQLKRYITSYLEAGVNYSFLFGDKKAREPDYDLAFFTDSAQKTVVEIPHEAPVINPEFKIPSKKKERNFTVLLWISIIAAVSILSFLSWKMMTELKLRDDK